MLMRNIVLAKERPQSSLSVVSIGWRGGFGGLESLYHNELSLKLSYPRRHELYRIKNAKI